MLREVQEINGLYGPFTLTEKALQTVWGRREFQSEGVRASTGVRIDVVDPGRWNRLDGPDFKEARLRIDGIDCVGDVEIHFELSDWYAHGHDRNPAYNHVLLHVVLYGAEAGAAGAVLDASGREVPTLVLLPLLETDLEAIATEEAIRELASCELPDWMLAFHALPVTERLKRMRLAARERFASKQRAADLRLREAGWEEACHQRMLEVLGYARNRVPMSRIASKWPLKHLAIEDWSAEALYQTEIGNWRLSGTRPANHPLRRLEQYQRIVRRTPNWPRKLKALLQLHGAHGCGLLSAGTEQVRRLASLPRLCAELDVVFGGEIGRSRLNTFVADGLLPLLAADRCPGADVLAFHWYAGDLPVALHQFLTRADIVRSRQRPLCNGWVQGALEYSLHEAAGGARR